MADTRVFANAVVRTMVDDRQRERAIALADGRILAVGDEEPVRRAAGEAAVIEDLDGRTVLPGFIDAHHHFAQAALHQASVDCGSDAVSGIEDLIESLRAVAEKLPAGAWIIGEGYDELALREGRHPDRNDLDRASPQNPVIIGHYSGHEGVANSKALELAGIGPDTPDPAAGLIIKGKKSRPTGRLIETAYSRVMTLAELDALKREPQPFFERLRNYQKDLFAVGITRLLDPAVSREMERIYSEALEQGALRIPLTMLPSSSEGLLCPPWDRLEGSRTGSGPEHLRIGHLKIFFDGGNRCALVMSLGQFLNSAGQALSKAVRTRSLAALKGGSDMQVRLGKDLKIRMGLNFYEVEDGRRLVEQACRAGFSIAIHALGNQAVDRAIDAIGHSRNLHPDQPPPQIIHACITGPDAARRMAELGIVAVVQPYFLQLPVFDTMPRPPGLGFMAYRTLLDAGVRLAGSSDAPVTDFDPLKALRSAVGRRSRSGVPIQPEEALTASEVLAMYTREAAYALGCLDVTGTLEPGKRADLVVLSRDPCKSSPEELLDLRVDKTILKGETVFSQAK